MNGGALVLLNSLPDIDKSPFLPYDVRNDEGILSERARTSDLAGAHPPRAGGLWSSHRSGDRSESQEIGGAQQRVRSTGAVGSQRAGKIRPWRSYIRARGPGQAVFSRYSPRDPRAARSSPRANHHVDRNSSIRRSQS